MDWNREGQQVIGNYLNMHTVTGTVISSRVKYGGKVQHLVLLENPITVFNRIADHVLLEEEDLIVKDSKEE